MTEPAPPASRQSSVREVAALVDALAPALSQGRRRRGFIDGRPGGGFRTDLHSILVPWPVPGFADAIDGRRALTCGIALQSAPTKELLVEVAPEIRGRAMERAVRWAEAEWAAGWVAARWPGLRSDLAQFLPDVEPAPPGNDGDALLASARGALRRQRPPWPALAGETPGSLTGGRRAGRSLRTTARFSVVATRELRRAHSWDIPVGGRGQRPSAAGDEGDRVDPGAVMSGRLVGIPYDEWDANAARYRRNWVRVIELDQRKSGALVPPRAEIVGWFRVGPDRVWRGRRPIGDDIDLDAWVDERLDVLACQPAEGLVYGVLAEAPRDVATAIVLDGSASMRARGEEVLRLELECAQALAAALREAHQRFGLFLFRGETRHRVEVHVLSDFNRRDMAPPDLSNIKPAGYTRLGAALRHVTTRLETVPARRRILLSLGDGIPSDEGYDGGYAREDVKRAVAEAREYGISVFHVGFGRPRDDPLPFMFGPGGHHRVDSLPELPRVLAEVHRSLRRQ